MTFAKALPLVSLLALTAGCEVAKSSPVGGQGVIVPPPTGDNVLQLTVNGSTCSASSYLNKPCVRIAVCVPGTSTCQTISDILVDTGSVGLRVFKGLLPASLPLAAAGSGTLAECLAFLDGSADWGPVAMADVVLGGEPAVAVPIHVIDSTFPGVPSSCPNPETSPSGAGFNGILGVGLFAEDCGAPCVASAGNQMYYACSGGTCTGTAVPVASQVQNPVVRLPVDNNGVIVDLPGVPLGGAGSVEGSLILGIDTQANNAPGGVKVFPADIVGEILTIFDGSTVSSFIDTGSNGLFFPGPASLPSCAAPSSAWFCPTSEPSARQQRVRRGRRRPSHAVRLGAPLLPGQAGLHRDRGEGLEPGRRAVLRLLGDLTGRGPRPATGSWASPGPRAG
jgi:hypothetical protein